ncbi:MAG: carbohydrate ABC transporter permease [Clostridia bacterium]|nr:carbohydrate ABC transporter permease [Clostridia bacterium]
MFKLKKKYFRAGRLKVTKRDQYKRFTRSKAGNFFYSFFLIAFGLFSILPMIYSILTSFKPLDELLVYPPRFFVIRPTLENYIVIPSLLDNLAVPLSRYIFNSIFISVVTTVLHVIVASMGAFVLSKSNIYGKKVIFAIIQFSLLYNSYTLAIPRYLIYSYLGMIDTYWVYILPMIPSSMGVFLMKQYMDAAVPTALIEAARIDGAGTFRVFWQLVMPIVKPGWLTLTLFAFRDLWQLVEGGTVFSEELKTLPSAASTIAAGGLTRQGSAMAVTVIMMIPPILVYMISQGSVTKTMSSSGIK